MLPHADSSSAKAPEPAVFGKHSVPSAWGVPIRSHPKQQAPLWLVARLVSMTAAWLSMAMSSPFAANDPRVERAMPFGEVSQEASACGLGSQSRPLDGP